MNITFPDQDISFEVVSYGTGARRGQGRVFGFILLGRLTKHRGYTATIQNAQLRHFWEQDLIASRNHRVLES